MADDTSSPVWGSLPLERYVLSQWLSSIEEDFDKRRRQLVRQFVALGQVGRLESLANPFDTDQPPRSTWQSILSPLRTDFLRKLALPYAFRNPEAYGIIWLRTCYEGNTDDAHAALVKRLNTDMAVSSKQNILEDQALYDYGDDWAQIFQVLPEHLFCITAGSQRVDLDAAHERNALLRGLQSDFLAGKFDEIMIEEESQRHLPGEDRPRTDEEINASIYRAKTSELHFWACVNYILIADKVALVTGKALIVFFDDCGRVVRQSRVEPEETESTAGAWFDGIIEEQAEFEGAQIGPDYLPGGVCGPPFRPSLVMSMRGVQV